MGSGSLISTFFYYLGAFGAFLISPFTLRGAIRPFNGNVLVQVTLFDRTSTGPVVNRRFRVFFQAVLTSSIQVVSWPLPFLLQDLICNRPRYARHSIPFRYHVRVVTCSPFKVNVHCRDRVYGSFFREGMHGVSSPWAVQPLRIRAPSRVQVFARPIPQTNHGTMFLPAFSRGVIFQGRHGWPVPTSQGSILLRRVPRFAATRPKRRFPMMARPLRGGNVKRKSFPVAPWVFVVNLANVTRRPTRGQRTRYYISFFRALSYPTTSFFGESVPCSS